MWRYSNRISRLPRFSQPKDPWTGIKIALAASAMGFLLLAPSGNAQTPAYGNDANSSVHQAAPLPPNSAGQSSVDASPDIRVVRLSDVEGSVQIKSGDQTEFAQAVMNMPLLQGSRIVTGTDGRAEIEFEDGSVARITPNSSLTLTTLASSPDGVFNTAIEQNSGLIYYELRNDPKSPYKVMAAGQSISPAADSTFRVNLTAAPPAVAVLDGALKVEGAADSEHADVKQNQTIDLATTAPANYRISDGIVPNGFDDWNEQRDQEAAQEAQNQTPARTQQGGGSIMDSGFGWSDLDTYGGWYPLPGYGMVWQPYGIDAGFDPYGYGTWGFYGGFGYSWISGYPWGWLPFHCGDWSYIDSFGWGWMPGPYGCGGFGIGFGYYGYGYGYWWRHRHGHDGDHDADDQARRHPYTNIARAPAGYRAPTPPTIVKGVMPARIVPVGTRPTWMRNQPANMAAFKTPNGRNGHPASLGRSVHFNGTKVAPLHSVMAGVHVPVRNAALFNNYPARAFPAGIRDSMLGHTQGGTAVIQARTNDFAGTPHRPMTADRASASNVPHAEPFGGRGVFSNRASFGQHTSFGPRGGFGGVHSAFSSGGAFRGSGGFHGGGFSGARSGGFSGGGHVGSSGGGGFHGGGGFSGGSHGGGGGGSHGGGGGGGHSH